MANRLFGTSNKFGTSNTFGASTSADAFLRWGIEIDWDGDGVFTGENEANGRLLSISRNRGRTNMIQSSGNGFEQVKSGSCSFTLRNNDGRYDGWNTASPLYPNVGYGKDVRITVKDQSTGIISPYFYGQITDIKTVNYGKDPQVIIDVEDGIRYLRDQSVGVALQQSVTPDEAIGLILDDANWPARWGRNLTASTDVIDYWWASGNKIAGSEINDIEQSFLGTFFVNASGQAVYLNRIVITESVAEFYQSEILRDIGLPQPFVNYRNVIKVKTHPRLASDTSVLYQLLGNIPSITTGDSITIWADLTYNNESVPALSIVTPAATTDYTMNTQADGGGTDKTANCTVSATLLGDTVKLVVANNSGATVYITKLQVRGIAIYTQNSAAITNPSNLATVTNKRQFTLDLLWQQDANVASDVSVLMGNFFSVNNIFPTIKIEQRPDLQFGVDLFDIVTLTVEKLGITGQSFRVGGISDNSISENCQTLETTYYLEPYIAAGDFWAWDTASDFGSTTIFGA